MVAFYFGNLLPDHWLDWGVFSCAMRSESRGLLLLWHLCWLCLSIATWLYDCWAFNRSGGKGFEGSFTYGGSWKYLTYWNLCLQVIYSLFAAVIDVVPYQIRPSGRAWRNLVLVSVVTPVSFFVVVVFWSLYFVDRDLIHSVDLDSFIPPSLNHLFHTNVLVYPLLDLGLIRLQPIPRRLHCLLSLSLFYFAYFSFSLLVYFVSEVWPYEFLNNMYLGGQCAFFSISFLFLVVFYFLGESIATSRPKWKKAIIVTLVSCCFGILIVDYKYHQTTPFIPSSIFL